MAQRASKIRLAMTSSTDAEVIAFAEAAKVMVYYLNLFDSIGIAVNLPVVINVDSVPGLGYTAHAPGRRSRHFVSRTLFLRDLVEHGSIAFNSIPSEDNVADLGTKNFPTTLF